MKRTGWSLALALFMICGASAESITVNSGMYFGVIEFTSSHYGDLKMGTNGSVTMTGNGIFYDGGAVPAQLTITGDEGIIEFRCSETAAVGGDKNGSLEIIDIEASVGVGLGPGDGTPCKGVSSSGTDPIILDLGATPNPRILLGGTLHIPFEGITNSQSFGTGSGDGTPLSVSSVFQ